MSDEIPSTMKAIVIRQMGDAHTLLYETDHPTPKLHQPNQILIRNRYAGLNFIDTYHRKGLYPRTLPFIAGQEGGGTVVAISDEVSSSKTTIKIGDVVVYSAFGSYAEYTIASIDKVVIIPKNIQLDVAIACMIQGLTAHYLTTSVHAGLIQPGEWCLIYGVGSGTCQWAAQMAKLRGFKVIGTCSEGKTENAKRIGCDELIVLKNCEGASHADYTSVDIVSKVMEITHQKGVKCIIDGVGKSTLDISLDCLAQRGIFVSFGNASGAVPAFPVLRLLAKSAYVTRPKLNDYMTTREEMMERAEEVFGWVQEGTLKVCVDRVFPLEKAAEGHLYLEEGKSRGKILFEI